jgi:hypothetical protein
MLHIAAEGLEDAVFLGRLLKGAGFSKLNSSSDWGPFSVLEPKSGIDEEAGQEELGLLVRNRSVCVFEKAGKLVCIEAYRGYTYAVDECINYLLENGTPAPRFCIFVDADDDFQGRLNWINRRFERKIGTNEFSVPFVPGGPLTSVLGKDVGLFLWPDSATAGTMETVVMELMGAIDANLLARVENLGRTPRNFNGNFPTGANLEKRLVAIFTSFVEKPSGSSAVKLDLLPNFPQAPPGSPRAKVEAYLTGILP